MIFGAQLGLTFNGMVDPTRDRISLSGTYVPAYGLNNAFAQIPIVGNILAGGRNEGCWRSPSAFRQGQPADGQRQSAVGRGARHLPQDLRVPERPDRRSAAVRPQPCGQLIFAHLGRLPSPGEASMQRLDWGVAKR